MAQEISMGDAGITERLEKIGDETIQQKGGSTYDSWKDFYDWLVNNPDYVNPCLSNAGGRGLVIIGGTRRDEFDKVRKGKNSKGPFDIGGIIPQTGVPGFPLRYPRSKYWPY